MDLNILHESNSAQNPNLKRTIEKAFEFGFECVAVNTVIPSSALSGKNINIPEPPTVDFTGQPGKKCRLVTRLTAIIEDNIHSHHLLKHPSTKKYDILAIQPVGEKVLQHVCSSLDVDIISLNFTENLNFRLKRKCLGQAMRKGTHFEILFAPCLRDQTSRRMVISNAQLLVDVTRTKNLIISSGASKLMEVRSVEDVINLGLLFGLQLDRSSAAVRKNGGLVLAHAAARNKSGCGFVSLSGMYRMPKHQGWIVKACKVPSLKQVAAPSSSLQKPPINVEGKGRKNSKKRRQDTNNSLTSKKIKKESDISLLPAILKQESGVSVTLANVKEESDVSIISANIKQESNGMITID